MKHLTKEEIELTEENIIRPAFGALPPEENWLKALDIGTVFLSRRKANLGGIQDFTYGEFCIVGKTEKGVRLAQPAGPPGWVDPVRFVNQMDCIEIIGKQDFIEVGGEDGEVDRPV